MDVLFGVTTAEARQVYLDAQTKNAQLEHSGSRGGAPIGLEYGKKDLEGEIEHEEYGKQQV